MYVCMQSEFNTHQDVDKNPNPVYKWINLFTRNHISLNRLLIRIKGLV